MMLCIFAHSLDYVLVYCDSSVDSVPLKSYSCVNKCFAHNSKSQ